MCCGLYNVVILYVYRLCLAFIIILSVILFYFVLFVVSLVLLFFFFFQAEDGIRDLTVTGVQTCALPISSRRRRPRGGVTSPPRGSAVTCSRDWPTVSPARARSKRGRAAWRARRSSRRSEERRVGKECRSRWSPYH